jgi:hypothetical protein
LTPTEKKSRCFVGIKRLPYRYVIDKYEFANISGAPIAYWISNKIRYAYQKGTALGKIAAPKKAIQL